MGVVPSCVSATPTPPLIGLAYTFTALTLAGLSDPAIGASILSSEGEWEFLPSSQELPTRPRYRTEQVSHTHGWWQRGCKRQKDRHREKRRKSRGREKGGDRPEPKRQ